MLLLPLDCGNFNRRAEKLYEFEFSGMSPRDQVEDIARNHIIADDHAIDIPLWLLGIVARHSNGRMNIQVACNLYMDVVLKRAHSK